MNIAGLVYNNNNNEAGVSSAASNRGVMAPDAHHYVQMQPHGEFADGYSHSQQYYEPTGQHVPQYELSGYQHGNPYHPPLRHQQPVVQHQQVQQQQQASQQQQQPHHAQHMHMQQSNQANTGRPASMQSVQQVQQAHRVQVSAPPPSQDMMPRTRTAMPVQRPTVQTHQPTHQQYRYPGQAQHSHPQPTPQALRQHQTQNGPVSQAFQQQQQQQQQQSQAVHSQHGQQGVHQQNQHAHQVQAQRQQSGQFGQVQQQAMQHQQQQAQQHRLPQQPPMSSPSQSHSSPQQAPAQTTQPSTPALPTPKLGSGIEFKTDVDTLMKAIQSKVPVGQTVKSPEMVKTQQLTPITPGMPMNNPMRSPYPYGNPQFTQQPVQMGRVEQKIVMSDINVLGVKDEVNGKRIQKPRKRYECTFPSCNKSFFQKTHLEIHTRAHSGDKPYTCNEPGCGQKFSQMGNLKTHQRRHTGEKPFQCEQCGKRFAQRGNVRAHRIVHEGAKPFVCRLESCGKQFTQLGNLKSHQNKFHAQTIRTLTDKFATLPDVSIMTPADRDLFLYFADLYKNSNRGIKGRGKDRKILAGASAQKGATTPGRTMSTSSASGSGMHTSNHEASMSPSSGSSTSSHHDQGSSHGHQYNDYSGHEMEEDSSVAGSPYQSHHPQPHPAQQQLPPLRGHVQGHLNQGMVPMTMVPPPQYGSHPGEMNRKYM